MRIASLLFHDVYRRDPRESGFASAAADRYKLSLSEFEAQLDGIAGARRDPPIGELEPDATFGRLPFVITVDDGGLSYYTIVADRLEALGWRGHCFVTTDQIGQPGFLTCAQIRELDARGHVVGGHSASHPPRFSACAPAEMLREWTRSRRTLEDILGHAVTTASLPGGYFSMQVAETAAEAGLRVLFTSEPATRVSANRGCLLVGRFTVRPRCLDDFSARIVSLSAGTRGVEWAGWNAKKVVKPLLGSTYARVADWLFEPFSRVHF